MRQSLRIRIFITIFISVSIIYAISTTLILLEVKQIFTQNLITETRKLIKNHTILFNKFFEEDIEILHSLKNTMSALSQQHRYENFLNDEDFIVEEIMQETDQFTALGINWEFAYIDSTYKKNHGRVKFDYFWENGSVKMMRDTLNLEKDDIDSYYYKFKRGKKDGVTDIYTYSYTGRQEDEQLVTSIAVPVLQNDQFVGLIVGDIALDRFSEIISEVKPVSEARTFLISESGNIVANSDNQHINKHIGEILKNDLVKHNVISKISELKSVYYVEKDEFGEENIVIIEPFYFGSIKSVWSVGVIIPKSTVSKISNRILFLGLVIAVFGFLLLIITVIVVSNSITKPINEAANSLFKLSKLEIKDDLKLEIKNKDEIGQMNGAINTLVDSLSEIKKFSQDISKGNLNTELKVKGDTDVLGHALLEMQRSLRIAKIEEEKREKEEKMQKWAVKGESDISTILREYAQNIDELAYQIISYLVKYTGASQGALFIINEEKRRIELQAAYAYNLRKFVQKHIPLGVGLVGRAVEENETIYITDIPEGYTSIISGLGEREPRSLLIVPFNFNKVIYAVVELASFEDFKPHVRRFVERIGVSVASTVANLKITLKSNELVADLQKRSDELSMKEEIMRENIEEMQTTQNEMQRRGEEYENVVSALNMVSYVVEYDMDRRIININDKFLKLIGKSKKEMIGTEQGVYMINEDRETQLNQLWEQLSLGKVTIFDQQAVIGTKILWFSEAYIPIFDDAGRPYKVINIINDITNWKDDK